MRISFFEEFPTEENLEKAVLLSFPSTIYVAARSAQQFYVSCDTLLALNPRVKPVYWPILEKSYWVSPFCDSEELAALHTELQDLSDRKRVLIDLEIPVLSKLQMFRNAKRFHQNKKIIRGMFSSMKTDIVTAEYPSLGDCSQAFLESMGLSVPLAMSRHTRTVMFYTTFIADRDVQNTIKRQIIRLNQLYGGRIHVGLGTIAPGIFGNEEILRPEELGRQLQFFRDEGIPEATLYRLGGLSEEYLDAISAITPS